MVHKSVVLKRDFVKIMFYKFVVGKGGEKTSL